MDFDCCCPSLSYSLHMWSYSLGVFVTVWNQSSDVKLLLELKLLCRRSLIEEKRLKLIWNFEVNLFASIVMATLFFPEMH